MKFSGQYLTYSEYKALGGSLDMTPFNLLEFEARRKIDERTFNRIVGNEIIPQEIKMCMFTLINIINSYSNEELSKKNIASESVGSYSVSYVTGSNAQDVIQSKNVELNDVIDKYLFGVMINGEHILYCGV